MGTRHEKATRSHKELTAPQKTARSRNAKRRADLKRHSLRKQKTSEQSSSEEKSIDQICISLPFSFWCVWRMCSQPKFLLFSLSEVAPIVDGALSTVSCKSRSTNVPAVQRVRAANVPLLLPFFSFFYEFLGSYCVSLHRSRNPPPSSRSLTNLFSAKPIPPYVHRRFPALCPQRRHLCVCLVFEAAVCVCCWNTGDCAVAAPCLLRLPAAAAPFKVTSSRIEGYTLLLGSFVALPFLLFAIMSFLK